MKFPKVAIINNGGSLPVPPVEGGGVEAWMYEVAKRLKRCQPSIFSTKPAGYAESELQIGNVRYKWTQLSLLDRCCCKAAQTTRCFQHRPYILKLIGKLKTEEFDIVHLHNCFSFIPFIKKTCPNSKIVVHLHNELLFESTILYSLREKLKSYFGMIDHIATVSNFLKNDTLKYFPGAKNISVIYNGVDSQRFKPLAQESILRIKRKYNIASDRKVILYAGRLVPEKGAHVLIKAAQEVIKKNPNVLLIIAGMRFSQFFYKNMVSPYISQLKRMSSKIRNNVIFPGYIDHLTGIHEIYAIADICVVPSIWPEPLGLVNLEAQSCGKALIASGIGGIPEIVKDGVTGVLVKPDDRESLSEAVLTLLENEELRRKLGQNAREQVLSNFTWEHTAQNCEKLYETLLKT